MTRVSRALTAALGLLLATGCTPQTTGPPPSLGREIAPHGRLRVAMIGSNPVLVVKKPDGSLGGVAIDVGTFVAGSSVIGLSPSCARMSHSPLLTLSNDVIFVDSQLFKKPSSSPLSMAKRISAVPL